MECEESDFHCQPQTSKNVFENYNAEEAIEDPNCFPMLHKVYEPTYLPRYRMNVPKVKRLRKPTKFRLYEKFEPRLVYKNHKVFRSNYEVTDFYARHSIFKKREITTIQEHEDFVHYNHRKNRFSRSSRKNSFNKSEEKLEMLIQKFKNELQSCVLKTTCVQNKASEDVTQMFSEIKI